MDTGVELLEENIERIEREVMRRWICSFLCLLLCIGLIMPASAATGYTVTIPTEKKITSGSTVSIPVTITGGNYNAVDIQLTYDPAKLEYASSTLSADKIKVGQGKIRVRFYGEAKSSGSTAFQLTFQLPDGKMEGSEVKIVADDVYVDNSAHALENDAPKATISNGTTKITISGYSVTLPSGFKGGETAYPGVDYTFSKPAGSTAYKVTAKIGEKEIPCKDNGDGTYTIAGSNITGPIVVTAKKSLVTSGTGGNNNHFIPGTGAASGTTDTGTAANYKQLWVQPYVELDNATVFLIAVSGTPKSGKTYAYNGDPMFFTKKYCSTGSSFGENVYLYLEIVKDGEPLLEEDIAKKITEVKETSPTIGVDLDMDGSGEINQKDARIVYNVYNALYWDFDDLPMASFLEADTNCDGIVNIKDADLVINGQTAQ